MRTVPPVSPGELLEEEFLKPLGLTKYRLAKDIRVPAQRIGEILSGSRESLYRALSAEGNPSFATVLKVAKAHGARLPAQAVPSGL